MKIRRLRGEMMRITFRLPAEERLEVERLAGRLPGRGISDYVREAVAEKNLREAKELPAGIGGEGREVQKP